VGCGGGGVAHSGALGEGEVLGPEALVEAVPVAGDEVGGGNHHAEAGGVEEQHPLGVVGPEPVREARGRRPAPE